MLFSYPRHARVVGLKEILISKKVAPLTEYLHVPYLSLLILGTNRRTLISLISLICAARHIHPVLVFEIVATTE